MAPRKKTLTRKSAGKPKKKPAPKAVAKKSARKAVPVKAKKPRARIKGPDGIPEKMRDAALKILDERKAEDTICFDLAGRSPVADYLIVASGRNARQLSAISHYLGEAFAQLGGQRTRVEGLPEANWVLVDGGDVIVHLFLPEVRGFYDIEGIWKKRGA